MHAYTRMFSLLAGRAARKGVDGVKETDSITYEDLKQISREMLVSKNLFCACLCVCLSEYVSEIQILREMLVSKNLL